MNLARLWPVLTSLPRSSVLLHVLVLALVALSACSTGNTDSEVAPADTGAGDAASESTGDSEDASAAQQADSDLAVELSCTFTVDGRVLFTLDAATKSDVREESEASVPLCMAKISGGQPDYDTGNPHPVYEMTVVYPDLTLPIPRCTTSETSSKTLSTSCGLGPLLPQSPGTHNVAIQVVDSLGARASDRVRVKYFWEDPERIDITFVSHEQDALVGIEESVPYRIEYKADRVTLAEQEGVLSEFNLLAGLDRFLIEWAFGSEAVASETTDTLAGVSTMTHSFTGSGDIRVITVTVTDQLLGMTGSVKRRVALLGPPYNGSIEIYGPDRLPPRVFTVEGSTLTPDPNLVEAIIATGRYDGTFGFPGLTCKVEVSGFEGNGTYDPSTRTIKGSWSIAFEYVGEDALPCRDMRGELTRSVGIQMGSTPPFTNAAVGFEGTINSRGIGNVDVTFKPDGTPIEYSVSPG